MPREHDEYLHHSGFAWEQSDVDGLLASSEQKVLTEDPVGDVEVDE